MRALSLFSGIGGIDLAAEWAGIETVAFCEYADFPRKVLNNHWPNVPIFKDVKDLNRAALEKEGVIDRNRTIELIHGGFPCQPYSSAGKQLGKKDDRDLWPEMFRIIKETRPRWVVGENVANFVNMELERTLADLESEDYETQTFIIPATAVNAKHQRNRTFVVAYSDSLRKQQSKRGISDFGRWSSYGCETMAHSSRKRWRQMEQYDRRGTNEKEANCAFGKCSFQRRGGASRWEPEPELGRVANGVPNRVDRIKSLGNAVVPQQIYPIFKAIMEIERVIYPTK